MISLTKSKIVSLIILLFLTTLTVYLSFQFDHSTKTIGKIIAEEIISTEKQVDEHGSTDNLTQQRLTISVLNQDYKGENITLENTYSYSQIKDHRYHKNDYVFINTSKKNNHLSATIIELKRDHFLIILTSILIMLLILIYDFSGIVTFISFILNGIILSGLFLWYQHMNSRLLLLLFIGAIPLLITLTLTIANGWNKKTKVAILITLLGSSLTFFIGFTVISLLSHKGLHYEEMELVTRPPHVLFLSSLLIGCVGAVMDVSMTITSSLFELTETKQDISKKELKATGKKIGEDIMGPMINIMFFSYLSGTIPLILIFLRNNMSFNYTFSIVLSLEIARALVGSIGIILTIPLSIELAALFFKGGDLIER